MSFLRNVAPVAGAAIMVLALAGGASAYQCKTTAESVVSSGSSQGSALGAGIAQWTAKVRGKHGLAWSVYSISVPVSQACQPAGGGGTQCVVAARPCKYVVQ